jgi:transposase InsO family protein
MLWEPSKMEQRYDAVLGVLRDGFNVTEVALKFGVSRQAVHQWLKRYEEGGLDALAERSHKPRASPHQMPAVIEARVLELRRHHPSWGQMHIRHQLEKQHVEPLPSLSGIYRALVRSGLIEERAKRKKLPTYKRWERGKPMELWQMDVVGGLLLDDGTDCKILDGIDDHSRFIVCAGVMTKAIARQVCGHFSAALEKHGVPEEILTDNGKVFTNRFGLTPTEVLFDRICRDNGVVHRLTAPGSPTTTGKIERFHRTLRDEFLRDRTFTSLDQAQSELDEWVEDYNLRRPHQSLKMATPAERFYATRSTIPTPALDLRAFNEDRSGGDWVSRTVSINGVISISNQMFSVGKQRSGHLVDVHVLATLLQVWDGAELIKSIPRTNSKEVRKKRAEPHRKRQNQ